MKVVVKKVFHGKKSSDETGLLGNQQTGFSCYSGFPGDKEVRNSCIMLTQIFSFL